MWTKWGVIVFSESPQDRDRQIRELTGADSGITPIIHITDEREATADEVAKHLKYQAWLERWLAAAKTATAGRHMANP